MKRMGVSVMVLGVVFSGWAATADTIWAADEPKGTVITPEVDEPKGTVVTSEADEPKGT
ncbi:MAG: hypothetical protein M0Z65_13895 [Firmicutes bacterium]|nr:hypothetical protein [Bacillota bacterium]